MDVVFTRADIGCHLDGIHGWRNNYRVVDMAVTHGMQLTDEDRTMLEEYRADTPASDVYTEDAQDAMLAQGGLVEKAIEHLQSITDDDLYWSMEACELVLFPQEYECNSCGEEREPHEGCCEDGEVVPTNDMG